MAAENNYLEMLEEVCEKLNKITSFKEVDIIDIKNSVESIENLVTDTQAKLNFQEIKEKLETLSFHVDSCNESLLKDLCNDLHTLKVSAEAVNENLANIQNSQNMAVTSAEFEEFQKQQLDLAIKTNENIFNELNAIKENTGSVNNSENVKQLENQLNSLHQNLTGYIQQIMTAIQSSPKIDEIGSVISDISSVNQKSIKQTNDLMKEIKDKLDNFHVEFNNKDFENQITKICEIYESLNIINDWIEKVGLINQSIENVYARLGENIDFDEVSDKVDIIYENITALNAWTMKIDKVDDSVKEVQEKLVALSEFVDDVRNLSETINSLKSHMNTDNNSNIDFEDISEKMDIVYENISAINIWANKIDIMANQMANLDEKLSEPSDNSEIISRIDTISYDIARINDSLENDEKSSKIDSISEGIVRINDSLNNNEISSKIAAISSDISKINDALDSNLITPDKIDNISYDISKINELLKENKISSKMDSISDDVARINATLDNNLISSKIDLIYENIDLLNDWVSKIDQLSQKSEEIDSKCNTAAENISEILINANKIIEDVPDIKDKLDDLSEKLQVITSSTKNDTESYIYTLLDIESDFLKLHKFLDDSTKLTSSDMNILKEKFAELNDDISSISVRTNKLILSADDANREFKTYLDSFKNTINELDQKSQDFNPELKFALLSQEISKMAGLLHRNITANENLNNAFMYLAEWIDASGSVLNSIQNDLVDVKQQQINSMINNSDTPEYVSEIKNIITSSVAKISELEDSFNNFRTEEVSEIKALITGLIVQLNTAITPDIQALSEKIDKLGEDNSAKLNELDSAIQNKLDQQSEQIKSLESKVDMLSSKFDTLIDIINNEQKNYEIKDILNYIVTQVTSVNENILNQQNPNSALEELSGKIENVDNNIEKLANNDESVEKLIKKVSDDIKKINEIKLADRITGIDSKIENINNTVSAMVNSGDLINEVSDKVTSVNSLVENLVNSESIKDVDDKLAKIDSNIKKINSINTAINKVSDKLESFDNNINKIVSYIEEE